MKQLLAFALILTATGCSVNNPTASTPPTVTISPAARPAKIIHDTIRLTVTKMVHDTLRSTVTKVVHDTITITRDVHDTLYLPAPISPASTQRTWFFRDLHLLPNTNQCLTNRVQQVIDSALALGGTTSLIISDEGTYNFSNASINTKGNATVTIDEGCYPNDNAIMAEITVDKCY